MTTKVPVRTVRRPQNRLDQEAAAAVRQRGYSQTELQLFFRIWRPVALPLITRGAG